MAPPSVRRAEPCSFANMVIEGRRARELTVDGLARACDLPVSVVAAVEAGDEPTPLVVDALRHALDLPAPGAAPLPVPTTNRHAMMLHLARRLNGVRKAHEAMPDVAAWRAAQDEAERVAAAADDVLAAAATSLEARRRWLMRVVQGVIGFEVCAAVASVLTDHGAKVLVATIAVVPVAAVAVLARSHATRVREVRERARAVPGPRRPERDAARAETLSLMTERGFLVDADGIQVVDIHHSPLGASRETKACEIFAVRVERAAPGHVTVHVRTVHGDLTMPWLRRTRELLDALRAMTARDDVPWTVVVDVPEVD